MDHRALRVKIYMFMLYHSLRKFECKDYVILLFFIELWGGFCNSIVMPTWLIATRYWDEVTNCKCRFLNNLIRKRKEYPEVQVPYVSQFTQCCDQNSFISSPQWDVRMRRFNCLQTMISLLKKFRGIFSIALSVEIIQLGNVQVQPSRTCKPFKIGRRKNIGRGGFRSYRDGSNLIARDYRIISVFVLLTNSNCNRLLYFPLLEFTIAFWTLII